MGNKLYVGNLSYQTRDEDLLSLFSQAGNVKSAQVVLDRETERSRGFGFVEMETQDEATKAISMFNGKTLQDRTLKVNEAENRSDRPRSGGGGGRSGGRRY